MKQRWLVVIVGLPALLAVLLACPAWATMIVVCGIAGIAAYELLHTAGKNVPTSIYLLTVAAAMPAMAHTSSMVAHAGHASNTNSSKGNPIATTSHLCFIVFPLSGCFSLTASRRRSAAPGADRR